MASFEDIFGFKAEDFDQSEMLFDNSPVAETYTEGEFVEDMFSDSTGDFLDVDDIFNTEVTAENIDELIERLSLPAREEKLVKSLPFSDKQKFVSESIAKVNMQRQLFEHSRFRHSNFSARSNRFNRYSDRLERSTFDRIRSGAKTATKLFTIPATTASSVYGAAQSYEQSSNQDIENDMSEWFGNSGKKTLSQSRSSYHNYRGQAKRIAAPNQRAMLKRDRVAKRFNRAQSKALTKDSKILVKQSKKLSAKNNAKKLTRKEAKKILAKTGKYSHVVRLKRTERFFARVSRAFRVVFAGVGGGIARALGVLAVPLCLILAGILLVVVIGAAAGGSSSSVSVGTLTGVEAEVAQYLINKGWDAVPIAAVMGNIYWESGFSTGDLGVDVGGRNLGLFSFSDTGPRAKFLDWCEANNYDPYTVQSQMEFVFNTEVGGWWNDWYPSRADNYEGRPTSASGKTLVDSDSVAFVNETSVEVATFSWMACYEGCGYSLNTSHLDKRQQSAYDYYIALTTSTYYGSNEIVARAYQQLGKPYVWGAYGPDSFDCSGLVSYCVTGKFAHTYSTYSIYFNSDGHWQNVFGDPQPGDIWVNDDGHNNGHTGVYIGDGQFIEAPHTGDVVKISPVRTYGKYVRYIP